MSVSLVPMRWWHIDEVMPLETALFGAEAWTEAILWSELARPGTRHFVVACAGGSPVGYAGLSIFDEEAHVQTIGVAVSHQGRGIGDLLLVDLLTAAAQRDVTTVLLEVRADNDVAQRLYARHGFRPIGVRRGYYQPSGVDAVVMARA